LCHTQACNMLVNKTVKSCFGGAHDKGICCELSKLHTHDLDPNKTFVSYTKHVTCL